VGDALGPSDDDGGGSNAGGGAFVAPLAGSADDGAPMGSARDVWTLVRRPEGRSGSRGAAIAALVSDRDGASASEPGATAGSWRAGAEAGDIDAPRIGGSAPADDSPATLDDTGTGDGSELEAVSSGTAAPPVVSAARRCTGRPTSDACEVRLSTA
jgi:hypothetical protein